MTKEQAIKLLNQVTANYKGTRGEHIKLQEAMATIQRLVEPPAESNDG